MQPKALDTGWFIKSLRSTDLSIDNSIKSNSCRFFSNMIASENDRLLYFSEVFFHPTQMERPNWYSVIDLNPKQLEVTCP
jgi:hypothetical protein